MLNIKLKPSYFYKNYNDELKHLEFIDKGSTQFIYKHPKYNNLVIKQLAIPCSIDNTMCSSNSCSLFSTIIMKDDLFKLWYSLKRIEKELQDIKYFAKIYELDDIKKRYIQEYVPYKLNKKMCPNNYHEQVKDLNKILRDRGYYLSDIDIDNIRVSEDGILKIIDTNVYTKSELKFANFLRKFGFKYYGGLEEIYILPNPDNEEKIKSINICDK